MPLYEYRCNECGHQFEKIQSFSAPEETECPVCKGTIERLISAPAVQFKGSGWYATDYASKGSGKKLEGKGGSEGGSKDSGSSAESGTKGGSDSNSSSSSTTASSTTPKKD